MRSLCFQSKKAGTENVAIATKRFRLQCCSHIALEKYFVSILCRDYVDSMETAWRQYGG